MTQINLLPWREGQREKQKKHFFISLGASAISALIVVIAVYFWFDGQIDGQGKRNQFLQREITQYNKQITQIKQLKKIRDSLIARMNIIQQLQENRPLIVHFFDELVKVIPKGVYFTKIVRNSDVITITGRVDSNTGVAQLLGNIERNFWLNKVKLEKIKEMKIQSFGAKVKAEPIYKEFSLRLLLKSKQAMKMVNE